MPDLLPPTPLEAGQSYATVAEILACQDLPEYPITPGYARVGGGWSPLWVRPDGSPMTILVRGLSFKERREVNMAAKDDDDTFVLESCLRGIKDPPFSKEQLSILEAKHPAALDQISDTIWALSDLPADLVAREVRRIAELPVEPPAQSPEMADARSRRRRPHPSPAPGPSA